MIGSALLLILQMIAWHGCKGFLQQSSLLKSNFKMKRPKVLQSSLASRGAAILPQRSVLSTTAGSMIAASLSIGDHLIHSGANTAKQIIENPEVRIGIGVKTLAPPFIRVANFLTLRLRRALGMHTDNCMLNNVEATKYANGLSYLLLANGVLSSVARSHPSSTLSNLLSPASKITYVAFGGTLADAVKDQLLSDQPHILNRATSFAIWGATSIVAADVVSTYTKQPVSKLLAYGGLGSAFTGLVVKDLSSNVFGGLSVITNDRFRPGDLVLFKAGGSEYNGRVESIGLTQTVIRSSKDNKLSYIPNALLAQTPVTNLSRSSLQSNKSGLIL